jgi:SAM-dependent methyltransferase
LSSIVKTYYKLSYWGKILLFVLLLLIVVVFFKQFKKNNNNEGFDIQNQLTVKSGQEVYDDFYVQIYDYLVFNNMKDDYEIGEIINSTHPTSESIILDIGSGTGHHVATLASKGYNVLGIDTSENMVKKAKENYPQSSFQVGDALKAMQFEPNSFTHILCLYFTIYYMQDKNVFFSNCMRWLKSGGFLILHVVNREEFDPILPPGNPLLLVSPQRYSKERITTTKIKFNDMSYSSKFELESDSNKAFFREKFKMDDSGKIRKNEHVMFMEPETDIITMAQNAGFIVQGKIDLINCHYEYQYLYILVKP